jgi:hypothetical protein
VTIRNLPAYISALWDWGFLDDCFGSTRIRVSDIDGIVERNGCFLLIEAKPPYKDMSRGQQRLHAALAAKGFAVLVIWGKANNPEQTQIWYPYRPKAEPVQLATLESIQDIVSRWFRWANTSGHKKAS